MARGPRPNAPARSTAAVRVPGRRRCARRGQARAEPWQSDLDDRAAADLEADDADVRVARAGGRARCRVPHWSGGVIGWKDVKPGNAWEVVVKIPRPSWSTRIRPPLRGTTEPEPGAEDVGGGGRRGLERVVAAEGHGPAQRVDPERQHVPAVLHEGLQQRGSAIRAASAPSPPARPLCGPSASAQNRSPGRRRSSGHRADELGRGTRGIAASSPKPGGRPFASGRASLIGPPASSVFGIPSPSSSTRILALPRERRQHDQ